MTDFPEIDDHLADLERMIVSVFNAEPVSAQPKYLVDIACGDGRGLARIHEIIKRNSLRGKMLDVAPLGVFGINGCDDKSENDAARWRGIERLSVGRAGDLLNEVVGTLRQRGIEDPEDAIYVLTEWPGHAGAPPSSSENIRATDAALAASSLLDQAEEWRKVLRNHGLIVSGSHAASVPASSRSRMLPVADRFLMLMAEGGLLPAPDAFHRYPRSRSAAELTIGRFKSRGYRIRLADETDLESLVRLEMECWPPGLQMPPGILKRRLTVFREGQLVLEADGRVLGVVYSQRIQTASFGGRTASNVHDLHDPAGPIAQLLALNVLPEAQYQSHGDQLLEFMLQYCAVVPGIDVVVGVTRCKDYAKHPGIPVEQYIGLRNERGRLVDTVLRFHELHGAAIEQAVAGYRPSDDINQGFGVLVKYDLHRRRRNEARIEGVAESGLEQGIAGFVVDAIASILRGVAADEIEPIQPLFELGLDSADLLDLNERISSRFGVHLDAAFFFEHNTCQRIISRVRELVRARTQSFEDAKLAHESSAARMNGAAAERETATKQAGYGTSADRTDDVAIVGVACLLPGGIDDPEQFWKLLDEGRQAISRLPPARWKWPSTIDPEGQHLGIDLGGFAEGIEKFDAGFFRISPREASVMDPQQRILLQLTWACLEDAGQLPQSIAGTRTGVFVGASGSDYQLRIAEELREEIDGHFGLATSMAVLANRLSYFYDLTGPSMQIDGACSSSLVAFHEATRSINTGQCSQALVAGIHIMCHPANSIAYYKAGMLATDGRCKTFDKAADGYVRGEGALAMLLKPLRDAMRDGNRIYGIIKGTATNHGGRAAGLTVPNPARQADLIEQACKVAGIDARSIGYVEAHGTGTSLGDPIEVRGLEEAFARCSAADDGEELPWCGLGSIKTNIGHLEAAAGLAGVLKTLLCLQHRKIPASLNFSQLNPHISLVATPFYIANKNQLWELRGGQQVRRAGVSSFGSGGANAHAIIEEYVAPRGHTADVAGGPALIVLSARNGDRLRARVERLVKAIDQRGLRDADLADIAYTLQVGREAMEYRLATMVGSIVELRAKLRAYLAGNSDLGDFHQGEVKRSRETAAFSEDEAMQEAVAKWIARGKYDRLLALWVKGFSFDWHQLYANARPRRIGLPTYPFAGDRYWLPGRTDTGLSTDAPPAVPEQISSLVTLTPVWEPVGVEAGTCWPSSTDRLVIVGGAPAHRAALRGHYPGAQQLEIPPEASPEVIGEQLRGLGEIDHIVWLAPYGLSGVAVDGAMIEGQRQGVVQCFRLIKAALNLGYGGKALGWTVITTQAQAVLPQEAVNPTHASVHGLIGSMAKEYPGWRVRLIDLPSDDGWPFGELLRLPFDPQGEGWGYRKGEWYRRLLLPSQLPDAKEALYRQGGVYVVIGGAGGIGEAWSECVIRTYGAQVVWIGRRPLDASIQSKQDRLAKFGPAPLYIEADATDRWALERAYARIKQDHAQVHGVIHSAIVLSDKSLARMEEASFVAALSAKVDVSVRLAQVFCEDALDFVLFFSSVLSFDKPAGQSNYAAGCTFKDAFAHELGRIWSCPVKVMNWGYWGNVGIVASADYRARMARAGFGSIEASEGMAALKVLLGGPQNQLALVKTVRPAETGGVAPVERSVGLLRAYSRKIPATVEKLRADRMLVPAAPPEVRADAREIDEIAGKLLWTQLIAAGFPASVQTDVTAIKAALGLRDSYCRWLDESLRVLVEHGYVACNGEAYSALQGMLPAADAAWREWEICKEAWQADLAIAVRIGLLETTLRALPSVLSGKVRATDVLFPNGSLALVEGIYKSNPVADYFNEALAGVVAGFIERRLKQDPAARIRILEVGAGTGATSARVFARLKSCAACIDEYRYTDLSQAFLLHAQEVYEPDNPYMRTSIFDVEKPIAGQEIDADGYDLVIAANVLHATRDIRHTLRNVKAALRSNGLLLLNEISSKSLFNHLTFGLLDGWWLYEDAALRLSGCPCLSPEAWLRVLRQEGFRSVFLATETADHLGQHVIVGESDGMVRQPQPQPRPSARAKVQVESHLPEMAWSNAAAPEFASAGSEDNLISATCKAYVRDAVANVLRTPPGRIDFDEPLTSYGIDSILAVTLANALRRVFGQVTNTVLFEHQTLTSLVAHLVETEREALIRLAGLQRQHFVVDEKSKAAASEASSRAAVETTGWQSGGFEQPLQRISVPLEETQRGRRPARQQQDLAIVGISGRYAGADNLEQFWANLRGARSAITEIPPDRWDWRTYFASEKGKAGSIYTKWGGFIRDIDKFDPLFFRITPREAERMDPQERLFLQEGYAAIEDAGYTPATLSESRKVGVFVGVTAGYYLSGSQFWSIANRVSYLFEFKGPSLAVDTACSSSLTALHLAAESLYNGSSDCAIAGGVNLIVAPAHYHTLADWTMLSPGDKVRAFGDGADGFVDGEGVGAVVLKPIAKAIADGDHIYGVIKSTAINHGGKTNGYTVPNPNAHKELVRVALEHAGVTARAVSYVEAHGTGTELGDPIEIVGLTKAFREHTTDNQFCAIGSAKSNIGHCESAAGIAGLTKVLLQLQHGELAPSLHSEVLNPHIDFANSPFVVQQHLAPWPRPVVERDGIRRELPRLAGISAFGAGGSNAHIVVGEYVPPSDVTRPAVNMTSARPALVVLSAKDDVRLKERIEQLIAAIKRRSLGDDDLVDVAYTLQVGREALESRLALIAGSMTELASKLRRYLAGERGVQDIYRGDVRREKEALAAFAADNDSARTIEAWVERGEYGRLLEMWAKGLSFDWLRLYGDAKPRRISLPSYPFARERYWAPVPRSLGMAASGVREAVHPPLHRDTSDPIAARFITHLSGQEACLRDDMANGLRVLPETAHLEMVRAAVKILAGADAHAVVRLGQVEWLRPVVIGKDGLDLHVELFSEDDGKTGYEIYSTGEDGARVMHSEGWAEALGGSPEASVEARAETLLLQRVWQARVLEPDAPPSYGQHWIVLCGRESWARQVEAEVRVVLPQARCVVVENRGEDELAQHYEGGVLQVLALLQRIVQDRPKDGALIQTVVPLGGEAAVFAGLAGLLKTARLEHPKLKGQLVAIGVQESVTRIAACLQESARAPDDSEVRYFGGSRQVSSWRELSRAEMSCAPVPVPWRDGSVYLITGGAGGLGLIFAEEIARRVKDAVVVLVGRSELDDSRRAQLSTLEGRGNRIDYRRVDVSDAAAVSALIASLRETYGGVNGILHAAGVIHDSFLIKKTAEEVGAVLAPKVSGLVNLDAATADLTMDFMVLFGSAAGAFGNVGQADYAAANAFLSSHSAHRNARVSRGERWGRTISIAWPLWRDGGMQVDAAVMREHRSVGMLPLETEKGLQAFYDAFAAGALITDDEEIAVLSGELSSLRANVAEVRTSRPQAPAEPGTGIDVDLLAEKTVQRLKQLLADITKLRPEQVDSREPLESYGIDSVMIMQLNHDLGVVFGKLSKTLFFEHPTLEAVAGYFVAEHGSACAKWTGLSEARPERQPTASPDRVHSSVRPLPLGLAKRKMTMRRGNGFAGEAREPIAIIGMSGRYPGAQNLEQFWENLQSGRDCIGELAGERWPLEGFYDPDPDQAAARGKSYSKWGGFLSDFAAFDPLFFNISPREAANIDPQERLFIESCWQALEDGGYTREQLRVHHRGRVGVFAGITKTGFAFHGPEPWRQEHHALPYTSFGSVANRVSYLLNLRGPSMPIDTMCSASLTAIHEACEHLYRDECELALAGGVNLYLHPRNYVELCSARMLSVEGRCKSFGKGGDGFVPGEGVGVLLLKRLSQAVAEEDQIHAVIRATSINHGGKTNGYTVPNPVAQKELVRTALEKAGVNARSVSYIEAHGTGTELGDPIEISGLTQAFGEDTAEKQFCAIGSAKSNIGHLEAAAGIAGVSKVVLQLKHRQLVPSLHAEELNPYIDFAGSPFVVQQHLAPWPRPVVERDGVRRELPRIAGVSSFGAGGSNAHVVIEEYVAAAERQGGSIAVSAVHPALVVLSAKTAERLKAQADQLVTAIEKRALGDADLADVAYTLQVGREAMEVRLAVMASSMAELSSKLRGWCADQRGIEELYQGEIRREKDTLAIFADEDMAGAIEALVAKAKYAKLLELWVKGLSFDWRRLYGEARPRRISLPTYPFARERYWIEPDTQVANAAANGSGAGILHPLLHRNSSDLSASRFSTRLSGEEPYLRVINGVRILPEVAHLEMARAAVEAAAGENGQASVQLEQVEWLQPVVVGPDGHELHVELFPDRDGRIGYEIYGADVDDNNKRMIHSQGWFAGEPVQSEKHVEAEAPVETIVDALQIGTVLLTPVWEPVARESGISWPLPTERVVIIGATPARKTALCQHYPSAQHLDIPLEAASETIGEQLRALGAIDHVVWLAPEERSESLTEDAIIEAQQRGVLQCFRLIKALLTLGYANKALGWTVITTHTQAIHNCDTANPTHASVHGLVGSMAKEHAKWKVRLVDLETERELQVSEIFSLPSDRRAHAWVCRDGVWYQHQLIRTQSDLPDRRSLFRTGGVYLIIGGAGEVGQIFSAYLARTYQAKIVWIGRRDKLAIQTKLDQLTALGCSAHYVSADAADRNALQRACEEVKQRYGKIDGVIHAAMVLSNRSLAELEESEFKVTLSAKVDVSVRIAQVFEKEALDFVLFFSSLISFIKNPLQSHYASGCTFEDAFARQLTERWSSSVKTMNWGYWGQGIPAEVADELLRLGIGFIDPAIAMQALERLLIGPVNQQGLLNTTRPVPLEGVSLNEWMSIQPSELPSLIERLPYPEQQRLDEVRALRIASEEGLPAMEASLAGLLFCQLNALGLFARDGSHSDAFDRWLEESLASLSARGYLKQREERYSAVDGAAPRAELARVEWEERKGEWLTDPNIVPYVDLVETTLRALPSVLSGAVRATDVMFPNGSLVLVERIYKDNPVADYFNSALAEMVVGFIEEQLKQDPSARIRILEVGAGTGGTSAKVLARLKSYTAYVEEYRYTDLSQAFLLHAQAVYGLDHPYVSYGIFDVDQPLVGQRLDAGSYDLVIAANVLHATRNIRRTLRNVKAALRTNGLLLLNEMISKSLFTHLTFGLLDGWWLYEDAKLRIPGSPALSAEGWCTVLQQEGFRSIVYPAAEAHALGQQVIVAESDGVVRQVRAKGRAPRKVAEPAAPVMRRDTVAHSVPSAVSVDGQDELLGKVRASLLREVAALIKVKVDALDAERELSEYGFDSISFTTLTNQLNRLYGLELMPTIFFEYPTLDHFARYLVDHHRVMLSARMMPSARTGVIESSEVTTKHVREARMRRRFAAPKFLTDEGVEPAMADVVAVIGMSGRFPMAEDLPALWRNLVEERDCIAEIPRERWDWQAIYGDPRETGKTNVKWGGFIDGIGEFDPLFFSISPREAELMDPQQRLMMTYVWKAIEDAGYSAASLAGSRTAILVGTGNSGYGRLIERSQAAIDGYSVTSVVPSVGPNRVSYFLDLHGPSEPIETACSSSLVAVHRAIQAIASENCEMAIAGGVNTLLSPDGYVTLGKAGMLSVDGRCKAFSKHANGYVRGEGIGMLVLKKLSAAERDGDHIYGVIRGSAENHGGRAQSLTAPNPKAQAELLKTAYSRAGIDPRTVGYIETHGTGTPLGDPIEINGLKSAFQELFGASGAPSVAQGYCGLGTVKSNIGHLELAAGVAGLIKVLLQLQHKTLVKSLHCEELNPYIQLEESPFYIVRETQAWQPMQDAQGRDLPRRAGVSSFGAGGVNAHVVVEEYVPRVNAACPSVAVKGVQPALAVLSAKNAERLRVQAEQLVAEIERRSFGDIDLADLAWTLQVGREAMECRLGMTASSMAELASKLRSWLVDERGIDGLYVGEIRREKETLSLLAADEDMAAAIEAWVAKGKHGKLLELWVKGLSIDWQRLYGEAKSRRISLPTYPFAKERYWIEAIDEPSQSRIVLAPRANGFDASAFERLLDRVSGDTLSVTDAVKETTKLLS